MDARPGEGHESGFLSTALACNETVVGRLNENESSGDIPSVDSFEAKHDLLHPVDTFDGVKLDADKIGELLTGYAEELNGNVEEVETCGEVPEKNEELEFDELKSDVETIEGSVTEDENPDDLLSAGCTDPKNEPLPAEKSVEIDETNQPGNTPDVCEPILKTHTTAICEEHIDGTHPLDNNNTPSLKHAETESDLLQLVETGYESEVRIDKEEEHQVLGPVLTDHEALEENINKIQSPVESTSECFEVDPENLLSQITETLGNGEPKKSESIGELKLEKTQEVDMLPSDEEIDVTLHHGSYAPVQDVPSSESSDTEGTEALAFGMSESSFVYDTDDQLKPTVSVVYETCGSFLDIGRIPLTDVTNPVSITTKEPSIPILETLHEPREVKFPEIPIDAGTPVGLQQCEDKAELLDEIQEDGLGHTPLTTCRDEENNVDKMEVASISNGAASDLESVKGDSTANVSDNASKLEENSETPVILDTLDGIGFVPGEDVEANVTEDSSPLTNSEDDNDSNELVGDISNHQDEEKSVLANQHLVLPEIQDLTELDTLKIGDKYKFAVTDASFVEKTEAQNLENIEIVQEDHREYQAKNSEFLEAEGDKPQPVETMDEVKRSVDETNELKLEALSGFTEIMEAQVEEGYCAPYNVIPSSEPSVPRNESLLKTLDEEELVGIETNPETKPEESHASFTSGSSLQQTLNPTPLLDTLSDKALDAVYDEEELLKHADVPVICENSEAFLDFDVPSSNKATDPDAIEHNITPTIGVIEEGEELTVPQIPMDAKVYNIEAQEPETKLERRYLSAEESVEVKPVTRYWDDENNFDQPDEVLTLENASAPISSKEEYSTNTVQEEIIFQDIPIPKILETLSGIGFVPEEEIETSMENPSPLDKVEFVEKGNEFTKPATTEEDDSNRNEVNEEPTTAEAEKTEMDEAQKISQSNECESEAGDASSVTQMRSPKDDPSKNLQAVVGEQQKGNNLKRYYRSSGRNFFRNPQALDTHPYQSAP